MESINTLTCAQLQALSVAGDQQIEDLYRKSRKNPSDPFSGAPRLSHYALQHPNKIDQSNPLWMNVYRAQLSWRTIKNQIIQRQRKMGCFQII